MLAKKCWHWSQGKKNWNGNARQIDKFYNLERHMNIAWFLPFCSQEVKQNRLLANSGYKWNHKIGCHRRKNFTKLFDLQKWERPSEKSWNCVFRIWIRIFQFIFEFLIGIFQIKFEYHNFTIFRWTLSLSHIPPKGESIGS